jgi:hypothetical protein
MKVSRQWIRRAFLWTATGATTAVMVVGGSSAEAAHTTPHEGSSQSRVALSLKRPDYPPPKGIYKPFTNCPLLNPLMRESLGGNATGCIAGDVRTGSIKIGNITTKIRFTAKVKYPVLVQFGVWDPPNATPDQFTGGILPPPEGLSAQLVTSRQLVPGGLLKTLGCPNSNATVHKQRGGKYLKVYAVAQSAGPITNFQLTTWTQPLEFNLINPLLSSHCSIGSSDNPVVINPTLTGTLVEEKDPQPRSHPDTAVLKIKAATTTDTTFTAPGVTGCGPGGSANIAIDEAIDASAGLPSISGDNSITLNGNFYFAACYWKRNMARILLSAFRASARTSGSQAVGHRIPFASLRDGGYGIRPQH